MANRKKLSYKDASEELERIVSEIESEEIDVDALTDKVKRAVFLINACREKLRRTENEVKKVLLEVEAGGPGPEEPEEEEEDKESKDATDRPLFGDGV